MRLMGEEFPGAKQLLLVFRVIRLGKYFRADFLLYWKKPIGTAWVKREALSEFKQTGGIVAMGRQEMKLFQTAPVLKRK